jgi:hypothetical protein
LAYAPGDEFPKAVNWRTICDFGSLMF